MAESPLEEDNIAEERQTFKEVLDTTNELRLKYTKSDLPIYLEEKDLSELSIEELDTDYQILFDMHQEMCKVRSKMNGLGRCKGLESYQNSRKLIETLIGNIS